MRPLAVRPARATIALEEALSLWRAGRGRSADVVDAAVVALLAGADSPILRELAGVQRRFATGDVVELVDGVQRELALTPLDPDVATEHRARDILERCLDGMLTPRAATRQVAELCNQGIWPEALSGILYCDERYSLAEEGFAALGSPAAIDRDVVAAARSLTGG